jgi:alkylation response protein AidB-like acyl-CoA dehydrogenase
VAADEQRDAASTLIGRAAGLRELLVERSPEAESLGRLAPDVVAALADAELLSLGPPPALGGHDTDIDTMVEIGYELAQGCMSTAWCWQIWTLHAWFTGHMTSSAAAAEIFANGPSMIIASGYNPRGARVQLVEGGCRISGRWGFSSGIDYADWVLLGVDLPGVERPKGAQTLMLLVPRGHVRAEDDWQVVGLKGTGSKTLVIDEPVFVPERRYVDIYRAEQGPASRVYGRASYALPVDVAIAFVMTAPYIGTAQAIIDDFVREIETKRDSFTGAAKSEDASIQIRIGNAAADVYTAISTVRESVREILELARRGETLTNEQRATYKLAHVYGVELARRAATHLFEISGVAGMFTSSRMLRRFCDLQAGSKHFGVRWDEHTESYGRTRLGLAPSSVIH